MKFGTSLGAVAALTLLASSISLAADGKTYKIGAAVYGLKGQFMQNWVRELKQHPAVKDGTVQITVFDGNYDALTQNNQIETMITQHYDAIIFVPIDTKAGVGTVARAMETIFRSSRPTLVWPGPKCPTSAMMMSRADACRLRPWSTRSKARATW